MKPTVKRIALKDISEYLRINNFKIMDENFDVWTVTPTKLDNKKTRNLNKKLGIHKINKSLNRNNFYK